MEGALPGTGDTDGVLALKEVTFHRVTDFEQQIAHVVCFTTTLLRHTGDPGL